VRLFVALQIPGEVRARLASLINDLRPLAPTIKWVRTENLHLTLKFIGEAEAQRIETIRAGLAKIRVRAAMELKFRGLGFFPNEKRPQVFWAGIDAPPVLTHLAGEIETELAGLGFPREDRTFAPHLTLARLDGARLAEAFRKAIEQRAGQEFGAMRPTEFHLVESKLKPARAEYTTVQTFLFSPET
jgi:RNA 2',3'-cyclic 3'-phosphodiesterase